MSENLNTDVGIFIIGWIMYFFLLSSNSWFVIMQEVNRKHKILSNFCASTFKDGTKRFESTIAMILFFVQIASPLPFTAWNSLSISSAEAVLYSPDTKVPRTGELALRKAIPANTNMKTIQVIFKTLCTSTIPLSTEWQIYLIFYFL